MLSAIRERQGPAPAEELLKLYWNRADVKRELKALRRERYELLDKLKEQEGAIQRAQEQLEGLERLLTNPLAAANAMVYFQLRHLWRVGAQRLEQFGRELRGADLLSLWEDADRDAVASLLRTVFADAAVGYGRFKAYSHTNRQANFEFVLLPLIHTGEAINRILGAITAIEPPATMACW